MSRLNYQQNYYQRHRTRILARYAELRRLQRLDRDWMRSKHWELRGGLWVPCRK